MVERLVIMTAADLIAPEHLPAPLRPGDVVTLGGPQSLREAREAFERAYILGELRAHGWNITQTSKALGIGRVNLWRKLKAYGISVPRRSDEPDEPDGPDE
jgi:two-component system nitrogen regulation response regulator NtrX